MAKQEISALAGFTSGSTNTVSNLKVNLQNGTDRLLYATWTWKKSHTANYKVAWRYYTNQGVWYMGSEDTVAGSSGWTVRATYTAPNNATQVACTVTPISTTYEKKSGDKTVTVNYWKATNKTATYKFADAWLPAVPAVPSVSITAGYTLKAEVNVTDPNTKQVEFEVVYDDTRTYKTGKADTKVNVVTQHAIFTCKVTGGHTYKVRARGVKPVTQKYRKRFSSHISDLRLTLSTFDAKSAWSEYSSSVATVPAAPTRITKHTVYTPNSLTLVWTKSNGATGYTLEYTTSKMFFDKSSLVSSVTVKEPGAYLEGLDSGRTWWFRVKATNAQGDSGWSEYYSVVLGVVPSAPTTWTETAVGVVGDTVRFYWMHNSEDGSSQTDADVQIALDNGDWQDAEPTYISTVDGEASYLTYQTFLTTTENLTDALGANVLDADGNVISTAVLSAYAEGVTIRWRVRTRGVLTTGGVSNDGYSPWSTERALILYGPPSVSLAISDTVESGMAVESFSAFPLYLTATANPSTQRAISWSISVVSNESYTTYDDTGQISRVSIGDEIYSEYIPGTGENTISKVISAGDINFENEKTYTVTVRVAMSSGMTAEASQSVQISWEASNLWPNAEVSVDPELLCAYIRPYCTDDEDNLIENVTLSIYRRNYDGRLTELITDLPNDRNTVFTDPHPSLDFARYRVVARSTETGQIGYYDLPGEEVSETGIIIQWDEAWSAFNVPSGDGDGLVNSAWAGSMLRLPYNIKVSESSSIDKALVEYIGRSAPVSYYGTQLGVSGSWSSEIPADDVDTRYALRRLQIWPGDAYVREPNGVGYWASVEVSFNKDYDNLLMPVTINVTRVEGGI